MVYPNAKKEATMKKNRRVEIEIVSCLKNWKMTNIICIFLYYDSSHLSLAPKRLFIKKLLKMIKIAFAESKKYYKKFNKEAIEANGY
jgi:hypothetical protein